MSVCPSFSELCYFSSVVCDMLWGIRTALRASQPETSAAAGDTALPPDGAVRSDCFSGVPAAKVFNLLWCMPLVSPRSSASCWTCHFSLLLWHQSLVWFLWLTSDGACSFGVLCCLFCRDLACPWRSCAVLFGLCKCCCYVIQWVLCLVGLGLEPEVIPSWKGAVEFLQISKAELSYSHPAVSISCLANWNSTELTVPCSFLCVT